MPLGARGVLARVAHGAIGQTQRSIAEVDPKLSRPGERFMSDARAGMKGVAVEKETSRYGPTRDAADERERRRVRLR